jgi:hypothetical protein
LHYPAIVGFTLALAALAYGQVPTAMIVQSGVPPKIKYAIRNDSSVAITAFIVMAKSGMTGGGYGIEDGFASAKGAVAPGSQEDVSFGKIVTALFADGSIWGDAEWAKLFKLRHQYQFEALGDAIADLEAAVRLHDPDLAKTLNTVRKKRKGQAAELVGSRTADLFEESTAEAKAANIQVLASEWRVTSIDMVYRDIIDTLEIRPPEKGGDVPETERVQRLIDKFHHTRDQLVAAQPELR